MSDTDAVADADVFSAFEPGSVVPNGWRDEGVTNVGRRLDPTSEQHGDLVLEEGGVYERIEVFGRLTAARSDWTTPPTVSDLLVHGSPAGTTNSGVAYGHNLDFGGVRLEWCTFDAGEQHTNGFQDGIAGGNYVASYCDLARGVDGMGGNTVGGGRLICCRVYHGHFRAFWNSGAGAPYADDFIDAEGVRRAAPFPRHADGRVHADAAQLQGWSGWLIDGSFLGGTRRTTSPAVHVDPATAAGRHVEQLADSSSEYQNSAVMLNCVAAHPLGATIRRSVLQGGAARVNISVVSGDLGQKIVVDANTFAPSLDPSGKAYGYDIYVQRGFAGQLTNNNHPDGTPADITWWGTAP